MIEIAPTDLWLAFWACMWSGLITMQLFNKDKPKRGRRG